MQHPQYHILLENLYRRFPNPKTGLLTTVLENVDLKVSPGEFVVLLGPSGCGKSTLFRICLGADLGYELGVDQEGEGKALINGAPIQLPDTTRGLVPQKYPLYPHLSVLQNVMIGLEFKHSMFHRFTHHKQLKAEAMEYLRMVDLAQHADKMPYQLSGGQQQRVAIAQTLITSPGIVFMDEPFGALDASTRERVQLFMLELWEKQKMTVVFVTHDIAEAVILGSRIVLLSQYYTDDRGDVDNFGKPIQRGSKIVRDIPLSREVLPMKAKGEPAFAAMVRDINEGAGWKPDHRRHVRDFDLTHPNSFSTLTEHEDKTGLGNGNMHKKRTVSV